MVKVRLKVSEKEAVGFVCAIVSSLLEKEIENCEQELNAKGYVDIELEPSTYRALEERLKKYSFIQVEVLGEVKDKIPVRVRLKGTTHPSLVCNILSGILGYRLDGCVEALSATGELTLELSPELAMRIVSSAKEYPFLEVRPLGNLQSTYQSMSYEGSAFERSWQLLKKNAGFFAVQGVVFVLLFILSMAPIIGFAFNILLWLVVYAVILYISVSYLGGQREDLQYGRVFGYMAPSVGIYLGSLVLLVGAVLFSVALFVLFGGLGAIHDAIYEEELGVGFITSLGVYFILLLLVSMYYFYAVPLVYSRVLLRGLDFTQGFLAVFYPFTPSGFKEAFSNAYLKKAGLWLVAVTVVIPLATVAAISIVFIPVAVLLVLWLFAYTAVVICEYVLEAYKTSL